MCRISIFLLILDLWGISFHAVIVFVLNKNFLSKSILGHCVLLHYVHTACKDRGVSFFLLFIPLCPIRLKNSNPVSKHWWLIVANLKFVASKIMSACTEFLGLYWIKIQRDGCDYRIIHPICSVLSSAFPSKGPSVSLWLGHNT